MRVVERGGDGGAASVGDRGEPCGAVGVKVAEDDGVGGVESVDEVVEAERVARRAGGDWRDVGVDDVE